MVDVKKIKIPITVLLALILILYIAASTGVFIAVLTASSALQLWLIPLLEYFNYIGFGFNETIALLIIPASVLLIINIKTIDFEKGVIICQILSFVSVLLILLSLFTPFVLYLSWLGDQSGVTNEVWGTVIPIFVVFLTEFVLNLIVFILMMIKRD